MHFSCPSRGAKTTSPWARPNSKWVGDPSPVPGWKDPRAFWQGTLDLAATLGLRQTQRSEVLAEARGRASAGEVGEVPF